MVMKCTTQMPCHVQALLRYSEEGQSCLKNLLNKIVENLSNSVDTASEVFQRRILFYSSNRSYRKEEWGIDFTA